MTKLRNKKHDIEAKYISKERTFYLDCVAVMNGGFWRRKKVKRSCLETHFFMSVKMLIKLLQIDISAYNIGTFCYNFSLFMQLIVIAKIKHFWGATMGMQKRFKLNWNNQLMNREKYHVGKIHSHECANDVFWPLGEISFENSPVRASYDNEDVTCWPSPSFKFNSKKSYVSALMWK